MASRVPLRRSIGAKYRLFGPSYYPRFPFPIRDDVGRNNALTGFTDSNSQNDCILDCSFVILESPDYAKERSASIRHRRLIRARWGRPRVHCFNDRWAQQCTCRALQASSVSESSYYIKTHMVSASRYAIHFVNSSPVYRTKVGFAGAILSLSFKIFELIQAKKFTASALPLFVRV